MDEKEIIENKEAAVTEPAEPGRADKEKIASLEDECSKLRDRHLRLYAEFENYKKRAQKDKEDIAKYGNESLLYEILPVLDNLEMALKHSENSVSENLVKGVEITLREFLRITEKFGLVPIAALGKLFDPSLHHAMSQVEKEDVEDKTVLEEFRKGYMLAEKVLRPSLVSVSKKPAAAYETKININNTSTEE